MTKTPPCLSWSPISASKSRRPRGNAPFRKGSGSTTAWQTWSVTARSFLTGPPGFGGAASTMPGNLVLSKVFVKVTCKDRQPYRSVLRITVSALLSSLQIYCVYQREPMNRSSRADTTCSHQHSCSGRKKATLSNLSQTGGLPWWTTTPIGRLTMNVTMWPPSTAPNTSAGWRAFPPRNASMRNLWVCSNRWSTAAVPRPGPRMLRNW